MHRISSRRIRDGSLNRREGWILCIPGHSGGRHFHLRRDSLLQRMNCMIHRGKKLKPEDQTRLDGAIGALESALSAEDLPRMRSASEDLERLLNAVGSYVNPSEGEHDDGAFDA